MTATYLTARLAGRIAVELLTAPEDTETMRSVVADLWSVGAHVTIWCPDRGAPERIAGVTRAGLELVRASEHPALSDARIVEWATLAEWARGEVRAA